MSEHSVADAQAHLADLIDRAIAGEEVVITRDGTPVVALRPMPPPAPKMSLEESLAWLRARRLPPILGPGEDAGTFVSRMRDEDNEKYK